MLGRVKVLGGVFVLGGIAAAHLTARETEPQMHPRIARLQALLTSVFIRVLDFDLIEMFTGDGHFQTSSAARSQFASRAPALYVLSKNSYRESSGEPAK